MSFQSIFVLQIAADFIFVLVIFFLLARLRKSLDNTRQSVIDHDLLLELRNLIGQSQRDSEQFLERLEGGCQRFNKLAISLGDREKQLTALLQEVDLKREHVSDRKQNPPVSAGERNYASIAELERRGLSVEEIAELTGLPSGEISLIIELEKLRQQE